MYKSKNIKSKRFWFWLSISINLGFLGVFKYYNFFAESFSNTISHLGMNVNPWTLKIILPVGISFYTFHGLSYVIDIYKNRIKAEHNLIDYSLFVAYFPLLVAGPIERATHLLPQLKSVKNFDYYQAVDGLKQILWGLFKKIVIADQCAQYSNLIFSNSNEYSGFSLIVGAILFTFQIYCDFSGYSDIALGTSRLFGIELLKNFAFPYFSRDIAEFWRRWHISLSSWFKDYLYIPLGGSKNGMWMKIRNTFIIFLVSGFWHGANWTFIIWGLLNAIYIMPSIILNTNRNNLDIIASDRIFPSLRELSCMILTFGLTVFAWIFFRAENLEHAFSFIYSMVSGLKDKEGYIQTINLFIGNNNISIIILLIIFTLIEWHGRRWNYAIECLGLRWKKTLRYLMYYSIIALIFWYYSSNTQEFIYFQF